VRWQVGGALARRGMMADRTPVHIDAKGLRPFMPSVRIVVHGRLRARPRP
jgi:hypothetical protein